MGAVQSGIMHTILRLRWLLETAVIRGLQLFLLAFPVRMASLLGEGLGWTLYSVLRVQRRQTLENLKIAFGDTTTPAERKRIAGKCYRNIGAVLFEFLCFFRLGKKKVEDFMVLENPEVLEEALAKGRGLVLAVAHLGNWELIGGGISSKGISIAAYVGRQHNPYADAIINQSRRSMGMGTISKEMGMRGMLRTMKQNNILALLPDQHFSRNTHFVRFFGRPVSMAPGMGALARHTGADVVFAESCRVGRFRYRTRFHKLDIPPKGENEEYDLLIISQAFMAALEDAVRRNPEAYFWMHKRWRTPPSRDRLSDTNHAFLQGLPPPETSRRPKSGKKSKESGTADSP